MRKQLSLTVLFLAVALMVSASSIAFAGYIAADTPIGNILSYRSGLGLSDKQVEKLEKFNEKIAVEISEVEKQIRIREREIERFMADWSRVHGTATHHLIQEYYDFQAKLKQLELESIMKARGVLSKEQMKLYGDLAAIEALMLRHKAEHAAAY